MSTPNSGNSNGFMAKSNEACRYVKTSLASQACKEFLAEFIGTFFIIAIGNGAVAAYKLRNKPDEVDYFAVNFCFGTGVLIGIAATIKISGAHLNPAVTTGFAAIRRFSWSKVWYYIVAQHLGSVMASAVVYLVHLEAIEHIDPHRQANVTGDIFATYPSQYVTITGAFIDQIVGTAFLLFAILSLSQGIKASDCATPPLMTMIITGVSTAFNYNCGAILNPARDFAPRLFTSLVGYGWEPFQPLGGHYWWVAGVVGPHIGGILGAWLYLLTIDHEGLRMSTSSASEIQETGHKDDSMNMKDVKDKMESISPRITVE